MSKLFQSRTALSPCEKIKIQSREEYDDDLDQHHGEREKCHIYWLLNSGAKELVAISERRGVGGRIDVLAIKDRLLFWF